MDIAVGVDVDAVGVWVVWGFVGAGVWVGVEVGSGVAAGCPTLIAEEKESEK